MSPEAIGILVDKGISFAAAFIALAYGYRYLGKPPGADPKFDAWYEKYGKMMRYCGWGMLVCFVPLLIADLMRLGAR